MRGEAKETGDKGRATNQASSHSRLSLILKGFCMGAADIVPGVSGGTMAFILGIYRELIEAVKSFDTAWVAGLLRLDFGTVFRRPHFGFLLPLVGGIVAALLFFTRIIPVPALLETHPEQVYGLFFGLIAGSCLVLIRNTPGFGGRDMLMMIAGFIPGFLVFNLTPASTPDTALFVFLSGALAICAMILPGISGSFILLILGKYAYIFNAIGYFRLSVLLPFVLGIIAGLAAFSRFLSWLLHRYYRGTMQFITGLLVASLWVIWPFRERIYEADKLVSSTPVLPAESGPGLLLSLALIVTGVLLVAAMDFAARKKLATAG